MGTITSRNGHHLSQAEADISPPDRAKLMNTANRIAGDWKRGDRERGRSVELSDGRLFYVQVTSLPPGTIQPVASLVEDAGR